MWSRFLLLWVLAGGIGVDARAAFTREAYVWQRQASPELTAALGEFAGQLDAFCVLAAEVGWRAGKLTIVRPTVDWRALAATRRPIGLALRIGAFAGPFVSDDATARALCDLARQILADARRAGVAPAELQIDFDSAESKLDGYRTWLRALSGAAGATPLVFTALPAWLKRGEFAALARSARGFILQVHSLERPLAPEQAFALCDPAQSLAWARQAARVGVPFRVALPTYGYELIFDAAGKFLALHAEGPRPVLGAGAQVRVVRAEPAPMAQLAQSLAANPPAHCTGVIWFRLPVAGERLNWEASTFAMVLRGEIPRTDLRVEVTWPRPGLAEIELVNAGQTTVSLPAHVRVRAASAAKPVASDGLGGFRLEMREGEVQALSHAAGGSAVAGLAPGRRMKIAWLRYAHELSLDVSLAAAP